MAWSEITRAQCRRDGLRYASAGRRGFDAGKTVRGRKRHIITGAEGQRRVGH